MTTPQRHPVSGQYVSPAVTGLPSGDLVNQELATKPDSPDDASSAVPSLPDHDQAMAAVPVPLDLPMGPDDDSKNTGGDDAGFPS